MLNSQIFSNKKNDLIFSKFFDILKLNNKFLLKRGE